MRNEQQTDRFRLDRDRYHTDRSNKRAQEDTVTVIEELHRQNLRLNQFSINENKIKRFNLLKMNTN